MTDAIDSQEVELPESLTDQFNMYQTFCELSKVGIEIKKWMVNGSNSQVSEQTKKIVPPTHISLMDNTSVVRS